MIPAKDLGIGMATYRGGRAEVHVRRQAVPVTYLDVLSMYPTTYVLQGLWRWVIAKKLRLVDATEEIRELVASFTEAELYRQEFWKRIPAFVKVLPQGEVLPARIKQDEGWQLALVHLYSDQPLWVPLADVLASILLCGRAPKILEAKRVVATGIQDTLRPVKLLGEIEVDPRRDDFFKKVIEERQRIKTEIRRTTDPEEQARLKTVANGLKLLANSTSYGITAEFNRKPADKGVAVIVYGQDEYGSEPYAAEEPGRYCNPLIAPMVTSAAWLILAMMEKFIRDRGTTYAFCDTDSMAVVGDGKVADELVKQFEALCPYAFGDSILKVEDVNFADREHKRRSRLYAYGISAKRYVLFNLRAGRPVIRDAKEHGLGHLISPRRSKKRFVKEWWSCLLACELGLDPERPSWYGWPAIGRLTISKPVLLKPFRNRGLPWEQQVKPFNFMLIAYPKMPAMVDGKPIRPVAPFEADRSKWPTLDWRDLRTGEPLVLDFGPDHAYLEGTVPVKTYGDVLEEYARHPESKAADLEGGPAGEDFVGELQRLHVRVTDIKHIGKEAHDLDIAEVLGNANETFLEYPPDLAGTLRRLEGVSDLEVARRSGLSRQQVWNLRTGSTVKTGSKTLAKLRMGIPLRSINRVRYYRASNH